MIIFANILREEGLIGARTFTPSLHTREHRMNLDRRTLIHAAALLPFAGAGSVAAQTAAAGAVPAACPTLLQHRANRLQDDKPQDLCQYAGKVLVVVNTASKCGFTPQYEGLEALHARYAARGVVVLGFPSNDFGGQEPGSATDIADFCFNTYGVKFPMFAKSVVRGPDAHPFYRALGRAAGDTPQWNFHKYVIDRRGRVVASFGSMVTPTGERMVGAIEKALAAG